MTLVEQTEREDGAPGKKKTYRVDKRKK